MSWTAASCLPQELIDEVLAELHDDKATLAACSVVHKSWLHTSRKHLFHTISLDSCAVPTRPHEVHTCAEIPDWMAFARVFKRIPYLAIFVSALRIKGGALPDPQDLDYLEEFDIMEGENGEQNLYGRYESITIGELSVMAGVLPKLKHVEIENIVIKPVNVSDCPSTPIPLESLYLTSVGTLDGANIFEIFDAFSPHDAYMSVFCRPAEYGEWPEPSHVPLGLTASKWFVRCEADDFPFLRRLVRTSFTQYVESLDIDVQDGGELLALLEILKSSPNLTRLRLDLYYSFWVEKPRVHLSCMCHSSSTTQPLLIFILMLS